MGRGTAGNIVATRLMLGNLTVAFVEAGGYYEFESVADIPAADAIPCGSNPDTESLIDWGFVTEEIPGATGRPIHFTRSKYLGGP